MSDVMDELRSDSLLNKVRAVFSSQAAKIEQASMQRRPLGIIEMRQMEFEAVIKIAKAMNVDLRGEHFNV